MQGEFFGFPLAESQSTAPMPMDISCSQSTASMEISSGLGFERPGAQTESEIESLAQAEVERTWGVYLKKVKLAPAQGYFGSTANFDLSDVGVVLDTKVTRTLGDSEQSEEMCLFALKDGRSAAVWVAHCNPLTCCGVCVFSVLGVVGPSVTDVAISLPEELRPYAAGFLRKSNTRM